MQFGPNQIILFMRSCKIVSDLVHSLVSHVDHRSPCPLQLSCLCASGFPMHQLISNFAANLELVVFDLPYTNPTGTQSGFNQINKLINFE